jgi:hypothetical protein
MVRCYREGELLDRFDLNESLRDLLVNWTGFIMPIQRTDGMLPQGEYTLHGLNVMCERVRVTLLQAVLTLEELQTTNYKVVMRNLAAEWLIDLMDTRGYDEIYVYYE